MGSKSRGRGGGRASRGGRKGAPWAGAPVGGRRTRAENAGVSRYAQVSNCAVSSPMLHMFIAALLPGCTTRFCVLVTAIVSNTLAASSQQQLSSKPLLVMLLVSTHATRPIICCSCSLLVLNTAPCREKVKMQPCTSVVSDFIVRATACLK